MTKHPSFGIQHIAPPIHALGSTLSSSSSPEGKQPFDIGPSLFPISRDIPTYLSKRFNRSKKPKTSSNSSSREQQQQQQQQRSGSNSGGGDGTGSNGGLDKSGSPNAGKKANLSGLLPGMMMGDSGQQGTDEKRKRMGKGSGDNDNGDEQEAAPVTINPDESYSPFHLADKSSFNPARLNSRQLRKMDKLTLAKYHAYEKPSAEIIQNIDESSARAKVWSKYEHRKLVEQCASIRTLLARKRGLVSPSEEAIALENSQKATDRMKDKFKNMAIARETELAFLVEGQPNSIDAIRLKEYLASKGAPIKLFKAHTDRDRLRVEELLSIRSQTQ
ncbi:hypothetical protein BDR26DRAFT_933173 [Obelidium mucronatum]|nr:hypothetical protein BDR26DRAFT_933173 [Obelidium mucronatum]